MSITKVPKKKREKGGGRRGPPSGPHRADQRAPPLPPPNPQPPPPPDQRQQLAELKNEGKTDDLPFPIYTLLFVKSLSLCFPFNIKYRSQRHREELFFMTVCNCLSTFSKRERLFFCLCDLNFKFSFDMERWHQEHREVKRGPPFQRAPPPLPTPPLPPLYLLLILFQLHQWGPVICRIFDCVLVC